MAAWPRSNARDLRSLEMVEDEAAPGLEIRRNRGDFVGRREPAVELVGLADADRPARGIRDEHRTQMDLADRRGVVVQQADEPQVRDEVGGELLRPFPPQATVEILD